MNTRRFTSLPGKQVVNFYLKYQNLPTVDVLKAFSVLCMFVKLVSGFELYLAEPWDKLIIWINFISGSSYFSQDPTIRQQLFPHSLRMSKSNFFCNFFKVFLLDVLLYRAANNS